MLCQGEEWGRSTSEQTYLITNLGLRGRGKGSDGGGNHKTRLALLTSCKPHCSPALGDKRPHLADEHTETQEAEVGAQVPQGIGGSGDRPRLGDFKRSGLWANFLLCPGAFPVGSLQGALGPHWTWERRLPAVGLGLPACL